MRIAVGVNHFAPLIGGCESVTRKIAEHLALNHEVFILTRRVTERKPGDYPSLHIKEYLPGSWRIFSDMLNDVNPDIVFVYSDVFDYFPFMASSAHDYRLIVALCGANWIHRNKSFANLLHRNIRKIDTIVCHSVHDRDYKLCSNPHILPKTVVIPNGVDLSEFESPLTREELLPDHTEKKWILNVSNFFPGKGQQHLVDIVRRLPDGKNNVYIQVSNDIDFSIGKKLENEWKTLAEIKLKDTHFVLKKNIDRKEVISFFMQSNVFAFTTEKEVAPLVLLESMAAELPWVAADVGNARGLKGGKYIPTLKDSRYHSVFDDRVKNLFSSSIQNLWKTPLVGQDGLEQIKKELTWDKILPQYDRLIHG